jgi:hypothetical protein
MEQNELEQVLQDFFVGQTLFTKYPELINGKDFVEEGFPFVEGGYDDQTIISETMRFLLVASLGGANFLMPEQAPIEQVIHLQEKLGIKFPNLLSYDNSDPVSYCGQIAALPDKSLHVLHPYGTIDPAKFFISPEILFQMNKKTNLQNLTSSIPGKISPSIEELKNLEPPFVIKKETGAAGDGVKIVKNLEGLCSVEDFLSQGEEFYVEEYVDAVNNYGLQFFIDSSGLPYFLGHNYQIVTSEGEYEGGCCALEEKVDEGLLKVGLGVCSKLVEKGYGGFFGLDVLEDKEGNYFVVDPNIRMTAVTPVFLMKEKLKELLGNYVSVSSSQMQANSPEEVINHLEGKGEILLSLSDKSPKGIFKYFAMQGGNSKEESMGALTNA